MACKPQVRLVHQRRGLQRVIAPLAPHVRRRNPTQLVVDGSQQLRFALG
jgi:hypothetical protein